MSSAVEPRDADPPAELAGPTLTEHESRSVETLVRMHADHKRASGRLQDLIDAATDFIGRPLPACLLLLAVIAWVVVTALRGQGVASAPFGWLELGATLASLFVAVMILVTQRRQDELAERRAQLTLEMALLADRRSAKVIALLEELRRDAPGVNDRADPESEAMARPADPQAVMAAIEARHPEHGA